MKVEWWDESSVEWTVGLKVSQRAVLRAGKRAVSLVVTTIGLMVVLKALRMAGPKVLLTVDRRVEVWADMKVVDSVYLMAAWKVD